jgi:hypothetical protein
MVATAKKVMVPAGPHEFVMQIAIGRPVGEVYPLLDLSDPRHAKRQLGGRLEPTGSQPRQFALIVSELPDAVFTLTVTHEAPEREYGYTCEAKPLFGRVARSHEHYALHPSGGDGCRIVLTHTVTFGAPLCHQAYGLEAMMLTFANYSALSKIKLHAEEGAEAVRSLMAAQQAAFDEIGCDTD